MRPAWGAATKHASGAMDTIYACLRKANPAAATILLQSMRLADFLGLQSAWCTLDNRVVEAILAGKGQKDARLNQGATHKIGGATEVPIERGFDPAIDFVICT